mmetsp:Transcript_6692/g.17138  ORF Transcript_6692/g.17138 Transcript_6692/m.17138 type:complete len:541 (-) Transcript_6692:501-2123(-)
MSIFADLKKKGDKRFVNPRSLAEAIVEAIPRKEELFAKTSVAGPGFINVTLSPVVLSERVQYAAQNSAEKNFKLAETSNAIFVRRVVVDYSSPNIAKEMHVGHLRSTIIGETICRAFEFVGIETIRLNHVGDWGTQFGMLITHLEDKGGSEKSQIGDLQAFYREAKLRFDGDEDFKTRSQAAVVKLQAGDERMLSRWKNICEISRREFEEIYKMLDVSILERGESFYNSMIPDVLEDLVQKKIAVRNEGALCIFQNPDDPPLICKKSDGGFNYASTDLAAIRQRITNLRADWIIYVTDVGQSKHFEGVFDAANRAGWLDRENGDSRVRIDHVGFGLVMGEDGKRFRTRSGDTVPLKSLLLEAQSRCLESLQSRETGLDPDKIQEASRAMGIGAVKYADLHNNRLTNYLFSYDRMLDLKGNTAVYLLYTHARISSVLARAAHKDIASLCMNDVVFTEEKERMLALTILKFPNAVESLIQELLPSRLCDYAYNLCVTFNEFYGSCKVIGSEEENSRLVLCHATAVYLRHSFHILGMKPLYKL